MSRTSNIKGYISVTMTQMTDVIDMSVKHCQDPPVSANHSYTPSTLHTVTACITLTPEPC